MNAFARIAGDPIAFQKFDVFVCFWKILQCLPDGRRWLKEQIASICLAVRPLVRHQWILGQRIVLAGAHEEKTLPALRHTVFGCVIDE